MKFLIDESVEKPIVDWLRDQKYDVIYIAESSSGITDEEVSPTLSPPNNSLTIMYHI